ncbi:MAG: mechanosensitive ion channel family protein [Niastella sp.]|nr:mechanosensitive ion channel family protein [Niastella sp.]
MEFLHHIILGNTIQNWLIVAGIILLALLLKRFISHRIASLLYTLLSTKWKNMEKRGFVRLTIKPTSWFIFLLISIITLDKLNFPPEFDHNIYGHSIAGIMDRLGVVMLVISFTWFVMSVVDFISLLLIYKAQQENEKSHGQLVVFFRDFLKVIIGIIGFLLLLKLAFNQDIGNLLTGLSIVGAALALAAKESLENLIASFIIFFDKPFFTGDAVTVDNLSGVVEKIGLRSTRLRTADKTLVTIPNRQMVSSAVDNLSMRTHRRCVMSFDLVATTQVATANECIAGIKKILATHDKLIQSNTVFVTDFSKTGLNITAEYFTIPFTLAEFNQLRQEIYLSIMKLMEDLKIELISSGNTIKLVNNTSTASKDSSIL